MATQKSINEIQGSIGNLTYYKAEDGTFRVRRKGGVSGDKVKNDPAFERTRENMAEFAEAARGGKILRASVNEYLERGKDSKLQSRLLTAMKHVLNTDTTNPRGSRKVANGDLTLVKEFEFNRLAPLSENLKVPLSTTVDRVTGSVLVSIPSFVPTSATTKPQGATHIRIVSIVAEIDFATKQHASDFQETAIIARDTTATTATTLTHTVSTNTTKPLFILVGLQFMQTLNGVYYPLKNGTFNAMQVIEVNVS